MVSVARLCTLEFSTPAGELTLRLCSATLAWESAGGLAGFQPGPSTGSSGSSRKPGGESECDPNAISGDELRAGARSKVTFPKEVGRYFAGRCGRVSRLTRPSHGCEASFGVSFPKRGRRTPPKPREAAPLCAHGRGSR